MQIINYPGNFYLSLTGFIQSHPGACIWGWRFVFLSAVAYCTLGVLAINKYRYTKEHRNLLVRLASSQWLMLAVIAIAVFILRLPNVVYECMDFDEAQWIANAATYKDGAVLWKDVTGFTSGPLVYAPLNSVLLFGKLNYSSVRLFGILICIIPSILLLWGAIKNFFDELTARIAIIPVFVAISVFSTDALLAYNSEHMPMLFISMAIYFMSIAYKGGFTQWLPLAALGIALGLIPYAKLQAVPIALTIGIYTLYLIFRKRNFAFNIKNPAVSLILAALLPTAVVALYISINNCWPSFINGYIITNLVHTKNGLGDFSKPATGLVKYLLIFHILDKENELKLMIAILLVPAVIFSLFTNFKSPFSQGFVFAALLVVAAYFSVIAPGYGYYHYIILFIVPFGFFAAAFIHYVLHHIKHTVIRHVFIGLSLVVCFISPLYHGYKDIKPINYTLQNKGSSISPVSVYIKGISRAGDKLSVWGWNHSYFVEAGLSQGNSHSHAFYAIAKPSLQNKWLLQMTAEMKANKPVFFIDDASPTAFVFNKPELKHENFEPLKELIAKSYTLTYTYEGKRLYILNERVQKL